MNKNNQQNLKELFYKFYCDILKLYKSKRPKCGISHVGSFKSKSNGHEVSANAKIHLLSASYYFDNTEKIQKLQSFKKIVSYIKKSPEILKADSVCSGSPVKGNIGKKMYENEGIENSYGALIYLVAQDIFENYNKTSVQIKWDFESSSPEKIKFDENVLLFGLKNKHSFLPTEKYFYYLQNLEIEKTFTLKTDAKKIQFRNLSDKEKSLFINSTHIGPEDLSRDIGFIKTAIVSNNLLDKNEVKNILTLLRIFKAGEFRLYAIGELKKELNQKQSIKVDTFANVVEKGLSSKSPFFHRKYELTGSDIIEFKKLFKNSYSEIHKFEFANECLSLLHSLDYKYRLPIIFYILESFFEKIKSENTYRLSYCITKILSKPYSFSETIKNFYTLRGKIVHGDNQSTLNKIIKKIQKDDGKPCNDIKQCVDLLESIMREVWKQILIKQFHLKKDIEEELF